MMKTLSICIISLFCLLGARNPDRMRIEGAADGIEGNKIYLGRVVNEFHGFFKVMDSAVIENGKFIFQVDHITPEVLFLGVDQGKGGLFFAEPGVINVRPGKIKDGKVNWEVSGSALDAGYRSFLRCSDSVRNQKTIDSLNELFYAAREKDNRVEMARIKEELIVYCDLAKPAEDRLVKETVKRNRDNEFGIYLYYTKLFAHKNFDKLDEVKKEREYLNSFGSLALATVYKSLMDSHLDLYAGCAIGAIAPEIIGQDTLGNPIKLSDLRGKYVLVDFWDSYCHWCREETPWLKKALVAFKDKNFTILGISDDRKKELWLKAIREDGSHWNHLLLFPGDKIMTTYCIKGIPHIILVGPDGKILSKNMRHGELTEIPAKYISK